MLAYPALVLIHAVLLERVCKEMGDPNQTPRRLPDAEVRDGWAGCSYAQPCALAKRQV